nr:FIST C-terminal domain-containing protein [Bacteroidota bacterium]
SCMARHKALGPIIIDEIREIYENTGTPITGFFTYGEIGNNRNMSCEFYNETCTLAVISEQ